MGHPQGVRRLVRLGLALTLAVGAVAVSGCASSVGATGSCDPSYRGACLDPNAADYDCDGGSGNGPLYTGQVQVVGDDYGLDRDGDRVGCDS
jgi:hypothetical protein